MNGLDLFCGEGGASTGYAQAGHTMTGIDHIATKRYPYQFIKAEAISYLKEHGIEYDFIHASPPCQHWSLMAQGFTWPDYIETLRLVLLDIGKPYIIENLPGSPLLNPIVLCGTQFPGLRVIRHRAFETSFPVLPLPHEKHPLVFTLDKRKPHYGKLDQDTSFVQVTGGGNCSLKNKQSAMGNLDWMTNDGINEAIPPAYTKYIAEFME